MYAAILNKKLVLAIEEAELVLTKAKQLNYEKYFCPTCHKRMVLVISQNKTAFFKHLAHYDNNALGEKEEHHTSKLMLKAAFTALGFPAQTEIPLAAGQLRADVLVSEKLAIEVQCAPLSRQEFQHRHRLYQQINVLDLWIVGRRHYLGKKLKQTQLIFFRENSLWQQYYVEVEPARHLLRLKYNIKQEPLTRRLRYQTAFFSLDEIGMKRFWQFKPKIKKYDLNPQMQQRYLEKQIKQKSKFGLMIAEQLYQRHLTIDDLPVAVFSTWREPGEADAVSTYLKNRQEKTNHGLD
ncbi:MULTISPECIES: competence protein CoiA [Lactobacillus]|uniref:Competence protein n=1 Tax=Lactobacillus xujianguonis TaxID=2495899 RepID=A0A437SSL1_9LACO|nr:MULTISPECIES: competence protein CoiA family protein [Lactobacillus]RVU69903.1 competence protein [Lactobacillus xujianguonis]